MIPKEIAAQEFIAKLKASPQWTLMKSTEHNGRLVLRVFEGGKVVFYMSPDALDMSDIGYRMFLAAMKGTAGE